MTLDMGDFMDEMATTIDAKYDLEATLAQNTLEIEKTLGEIKKQEILSTQEAWSDMITSAIMGVNSLEDAFKVTIKSMIANMIKQNLLFGMSKGMAGKATGGILGGIAKFAGGLLSGPLSFLGGIFDEGGMVGQGPNMGSTGHRIIMARNDERVLSPSETRDYNAGKTNANKNFHFHLANGMTPSDFEDTFIRLMERNSEIKTIIRQAR